MTRTILYYEHPTGARRGVPVGPGGVYTVCEGVRWLLGVIAVSAESDPTLGTWYCEGGR